MTITTECFVSLATIVECMMVEVFGSHLLAGVMILGIAMYLMFRAGFSFTASVPVSLILLFALFYWTMQDLVFRTIATIIIFFAAIILAIVVIRHFFR